MFNKLYPLAVAAVLGIGALAIPAGTASAAITYLPNQLSMTESDGLLQQVDHRRGHRFLKRKGGVYWDRRRHGERYRYRSHRHRHYYDGYYYSTPWWLFTAPLVIGGTYAAGRHYHGGDRHVQWCYDRYRSYNARTNTWVSYSGEVRQCISPYS